VLKIPVARNAHSETTIGLSVIESCLVGKCRGAFCFFAFIGTIGLVATQIAPLRRLVCASPAYLERRGRPIAPLDLLQHNCLTVASAPAPPDWWRFSGVNRNRALPVQGNLRTDDTDTLLQAAVAGVGIVHLASWLVSEMIMAGRLVALFPNAQPPKGALPAIHAVRMPGRSDTGKASLFVAHLRKAFGEPPYWERGLGKAQRLAPVR
jgi:DNA-binding transcriptional LysR family regulator